MKAKINLRLVAMLAVVLVASLLFLVRSDRAISAPGPTANNILNRELAIERGQSQRAKWQQPLSSGVIYALLGIAGDLDARADAAGPKSTPRGQLNPPASATGGCPNRYVGGAAGNGSPNVKVNQDCSLRRQAEEVVAVNPTNPNNLIAGQNDSRIGFNHCGYDWSFDGGKTWGDMVPPFYQFLLASGHTSDACSDPTATFDAGGNAYVGGVLFDVFSPASAFVVAKSNAAIGGRFFHTPAPLPFQEYRNVPLGVIANDNDPSIFHDKEFIVADAGSASLKQNNVYATWTRFATTDAGVGGNSPIFFSQSTDGGATWSPGIEISGANPEVCTDFSGEVDPSACDQDQGSHPIVGPDGTVYVAFGNYNVPGFGVGQVLMVSCAPSADCSNPASWTAPAKVGDMLELHPVGPSAEGCPPGRQCLPPNGYRVPMVTSISASVDRNNKLYVSWTDGRNLGANCQGPAATATPPCDSDILYAYSTDGGATWSASHKLTPAGSAQWQSWSAVAPDGNKLWVAYYDRSYGNCEFDGCNDITLAKVENAASEAPTVSYTRLTTASMPNLTPANNPLQAGFLGDYMWVATDAKGKAYVTWADTRGLGGTVEEDIYFTTAK
jgi:hypothetical protein